MEAAVIIQLISTFGPPAIGLIDNLITIAENKGIVTAAQWATLSASLKQNAASIMTAQLTAAGISLTSPEGVAMLALASK